MTQQGMSLDVFRVWAELPENADREYELVNGIVKEMHYVTTAQSSIHTHIVFAVHMYCRQNQLPCRTSGPFGAYDILGHVLSPDFAYKPTPMIDAYPDPVPPLWVVEIISPNDKGIDIRAKREIYRQAGILYWELYPQSGSMDVYAPGEPMRTVGIDGVLDGGTVLPGFTLPLRDLLPEK
jgi:Uma2 family endonuclease